MNFLVHLFLPHHSNNHRPKILHHQPLLFLLLVLCVAQLLMFIIKTTNPYILGIATDITVERLLEETNNKRQENGVASLALDKELSLAAFQKAQDMFARDYWAHNGPDGTTPWVFIKEAGYEYAFAGENLAKDFSASSDVVSAWMASPRHKDNVLSKNFEDIGFAVVEGKLNGRDTTLIVQMFGKRQSTTLAKNPSENIQQASQKTQLEISPLVQGVVRQPLFNVNQISKSLALTLLSMLTIVFLIDMVIIERRRIIRLVGHNFDHILFLSGPMLFSLIGKGGSIL